MATISTIRVMKNHAMWSISLGVLGWIDRLGGFYLAKPVCYIC